MSHLIVYHADCSDGFCAAWLATRALSGSTWELVPARYGDPPPIELARGKTVLVLDFSYPPEELRGLCEVAEGVTVLDHHESAIRKLAGFEAPNCRLRLDKTRSGAGLAKDFLMLRSRLADYVEDRDLWRWALPNSRAVNAWLSTYPQDLDRWDVLERVLGETYWRVVQDGEAVLRHVGNAVRRLAARARPVTLLGREAVACPSYCYHSELAEHLLSSGEHRTAIIWNTWTNGGGLSLSLRGDGAREIAEALGGGGHDGAAGCRIEGATIPWEYRAPIVSPQAGNTE